MLYSQAVKDIQGFASWLIDSAQLDYPTGGAWDLGFEVCFYRDYLWQLGRSAKGKGFPPKRTFDFCLFGENQLIVVEAKVCGQFNSKQNKEFELDKKRIRELPYLGHLRIAVVALASSRYFANAVKYGWPQTLAGFDGRVSWAQAAKKYGHPDLQRAGSLYKLKSGALLLN
ncbi:hypothetical protein [Desulfonatronospira sp.]|uniref:hypothetical protein n=1 Tax=Desulfonatronospira sp. TaxID=1962951 RepID=UPI0025BE1502|nr:hypothetical protein [Desulfonatronospira sp.]